MKILLITHTFPPYPGVASRRWAKMLKYLHRDYKIPFCVLTSQVPSKFSTGHGLNTDISEFESNIIRVKSKYPRYVEFKPVTIYERFVSKFQYAYLRNFTKGNYFDRSIFYKDYFDKLIPHIIRKYSISHVILSGAPFRYFFYALNLKSLGVKVVIDYRDPWSDFNFGYDNPELSSGTRYNYEYNLERQVLRSADLTIVVSEFQKLLIQKKEPCVNRVEVVSNGFDEDDFVGVGHSNLSINSNLIKFCHLGTLSPDKAKYYIPLIEGFKDCIEDLNMQLELHFVGNIPNDIVNLVEANKEKYSFVKILGNLGLNEGLKILSSSDIALWMKYDQSSGDFATKYYEYMRLKKYLWVFTKPGLVSQYIEQNEQGKIFIDNHNIKEQVKLEIKNLINQGIPKVKSLSLEKLSVSHQLERLIKFLHEI